MDFVLVRPGELALKQDNRPFFERILAQNLALALGVKRQAIERQRGRFYVGPVDDAGGAARRAARVFGVAGTSPATRLPSQPDAIVCQAVALMQQTLSARGPGPVRFRVSARRADKRFPIDSMRLQSVLGKALQDADARLVVDLEHAELDLGVEVRTEGTFLYLEKIDGVGGLPVGSQGRVLALLSGGIDSPVAAWLMMKRGCRVDLVHFDARPFTGPQAVEKVRALARTLATWQHGVRLWLVPFADVQLALKDLPEDSYRTVLYRRFMLRIAESIAERTRARALVAGDSLGQVASQTLRNLALVEKAARHLPLLRPLLCYDKLETMALARRIGTYETSILPYSDCCTLFQPRHPVTAGRQDVAADLERGVDVERLVAEAAERALSEELPG